MLKLELKYNILQIIMSYKVCIDIGGTTFSFIIFINEDIFYHSKTYNIDSFINHIEFVNYLVNEIKNVINEDEIVKIGNDSILLLTVHVVIYVLTK